MVLTFSELAVLSLLLEVSSTPKAGNVDRDHDHSDLKFQHFLFSGVASLEAFRMVEEGEGIGKGVYTAVKRSVELCKRNVHFGAFLLLVPLVKASSSLSRSLASPAPSSLRVSTPNFSALSTHAIPSSTPSTPTHTREEVAKRALKLLGESGVEDSIFILRAFRESGARVADVERGNLKTASEEWLEREGVNLLEWMKMGKKENVIASELVEGYRLSLEGARAIEDRLRSGFSLNDSIVYAYHYLLSKCVDPLIAAKFGREVAEEVREMARRAVSKEDFKELDEKLISLSINPGSVADLTASSIYLCLVESEGMRLALERIR